MQPIGSGHAKDALQAALLERLRQEERALQAQHQQLLDEEQKLRDVEGVLKTLHERIRRPVMVPFGGVAFFRGELVHTNEVLVQQGQQPGHMVECSTADAAAVLRRRAEALGPKLGESGRELERVAGQIEEAQGMTRNEEGEEIVEIREDWEEGVHSMHSSSASKRSRGSNGSGPSLQRPAAAATATPAAAGISAGAGGWGGLEGGSEEGDLELAGSDAAFGDEEEGAEEGAWEEGGEARAQWRGEEGGSDEEEGAAENSAGGEEDDFDALLARMEALELLEQQWEDSHAAQPAPAAALAPGTAAASKAGAGAGGPAPLRAAGTLPPAPAAVGQRGAGGSKPSGSGQASGKGGLKPGFLLGSKSKAPLPAQQAQQGAGSRQVAAQSGGGPTAAAGHPCSLAFTGVVREREALGAAALATAEAGPHLIMAAGVPGAAGGTSRFAAPGPRGGSEHAVGGDPLSRGLGTAGTAGGGVANGAPAAACFPPPGAFGVGAQQAEQAQQPQRVSRFKQRRAGLE